MIAALTLGVCLQWASAPQVSPQFIPTTAFTLAWVHTIEKVRWEEDYSVHYDLASKQVVLYADVARIKGSAAGMEPPEDAVLKKGWYHYVPSNPSPQLLRLTRSEFSADYDWCDSTGCTTLSDWFLSDGGVTLLRPCARIDSAQNSLLLTE